MYNFISTVRLALRVRFRNTVLCWRRRRRRSIVTLVHITSDQQMQTKNAQFEQHFLLILHDLFNIMVSIFHQILITRGVILSSTDEQQRQKQNAYQKFNLNIIPFLTAKHSYFMINTSLDLFGLFFLFLSTEHSDWISRSSEVLVFVVFFFLCVLLIWAYKSGVYRIKWQNHKHQTKRHPTRAVNMTIVEWVCQK